MSRRKNGKWKKLIALAINLQLVITTSAFARNQQADGSWNTAADITSGITQMGSAAMQGMQQMQAQQMAQQQTMMMQQSFGLKTVDPTQVPPIFSQNGCAVLDARPTYPVDKCENYDASQAQNGYYKGLLDVATNNENDLENFLTSGHERFTTQGVGCYEKSLKQFTQALNSRVEAISKLEAAIEEQVAAFEKNTEKLREDLKKGNALLTGEPKEMIKDMQFEDQFNDPQCRSFIGESNFKSTGKKSGFRGIQDLISNVVKNPGKGSMAPESFKGKRNSIKKEIKEIAKRIGSHVKRKKSFQVDPTGLGLRSKYFKSSNSTLGAILKESATQSASQIDDLKRDLNKVVEKDEDLSQMIQGIEQDSIDLDNAMYVYERKKKNKCLNGYLKSNFGSITGIANKLQDPNISKKANRESDSAFKNSVSAILKDDQYTIEEKMKLIKKEENKSGNDRYSFTTGKSTHIKGKVIGASTRLRASDMLSVFTDNCVEVFNHQRNSKGKSARSALKAIKNYKTQYNNLQKKFAGQVQEKIISEMVNCPAEQTEGTGTMSCDEALNVNSGNFCLRTANKCAGNMLACRDKADKIVETTRQEQKKLAKQYKTHMDGLKVQLAKTFKSTNKVMEATARQLDGMFQMGSTYNVPVGLDLSLMTDKLLTEKGFDPSLKLEDPKAYLKMMKNNIGKLKDSVIASNKEILNGKPTGKGEVSSDSAAGKYSGVKGEVKKYVKNYKDQLGQWSKIKQSCSNMIDQHNQMVAEQNNQQGEQDAKVAEVCKKLNAFNEHPAGFCGEASELGDSVFEIAAVAGDSRAAGQLKAFDNTCDSFNNENGSNTTDNSYFNSGRSIASQSPQEFCDEYGDEVNACDTYENLKKDFKADKECSGDIKDMIEHDDDIEVYVLYEIKKEEIDNQTKFAINFDKQKALFKDEDTGYSECKEKHKKYYEQNGEVSINGQCEKKKLSEIEDDDLQKDYIRNNSEDLFDKYSCYDKDYIDSKTIDTFEESKAVIAKYIAQKQRAQMYADVGDVSVSFCNAQYGGEVGKEFMNQMGEQMGRGLAGGMPNYGMGM